MKPFELRRPARQAVPFVFNSPHSGRFYPPAFLDQARLDSRAIRRSEDYFVDELFAAVVGCGAPFLSANFPRAFLDVNREPYELDPRMFEGRLPPFANISSLRVAGGLGTIPRVVAENMEIYRSRLPAEEAVDRVERFYRPYHEALRELILETRATFGHAVLVDCHSMPASVRMIGGAARPDFIVGDRFGTSADAQVTRTASLLLKGMGYSVAQNKPYAGGFITEHYGRPGQRLHALQIEINRSLYVDEESLQKTNGFFRLVDDLGRFCRGLTDLVLDSPGAPPIAAE